MRRYKEEQRRQLAFHVDIVNNQSVNLFCTGTRRSRDASWPPERALPTINQLTSIVRMRRYKEERRRQLAAHVATRLTSNASSSEEEEADRRSFTEFRSAFSPHSLIFKKILLSSVVP